jgi:hypothetical protein
MGQKWDLNSTIKKGREAFFDFFNNQGLIKCIVCSVSG